ncbi:MAG TPA: glycosyltransferase family 4 protein [Candidatus Limnocylindrales bacterium]|nr:glycosyltransferase family 4 protein [Candidatus Limnocylindrales bacterium]
MQTVVGFAARLAARGHDVSIVFPRGASDPSLIDRLGPSVKTVEAGGGLTAAMSLPSMGRLAVALARAVPDADVILATHAPTAVPVLLASRRKRERRAMWFYQDYMDMFVERPFERAILRHLPPRFEQLVTVSEAAADDARSRGARRVTNVRTGISDPELFHPPSDWASRVPGLLACITDMRPRKGLADLLAAAERLFDRMPSIRLAIVSKEECAIRTRVPFDLHLRPPRSQIADLFRRCSAFVSPTWSESFGLPALEAMACGAPVVTTETLGAREYASAGVNCLLVPPRDPVALAAAVERVLRDADLARRLSQAGAATARTFEWKECVSRLERALSE